MSEIRELILERVVNPSSRGNLVHEVVGTVTDVDEVNNWCSVEYVDRDGYRSNRDNVWVKQYDGSQPWFPSVDDQVTIEDTGDSAIVTGKSYQNYAIQMGTKRELTMDSCPDNMGASMGGYIF